MMILNNTPLESTIQNNEFLKEGEMLSLFRMMRKPLSASLPHLILEISETEPGIKGNTATNTLSLQKLKQELKSRFLSSLMLVTK